MEPVTLVALGAAGYVVKKVADAGAEVVLLRGRVALVEAACRLPTGSEITVVGNDGSRWLVRAGAGELSR
ncbi:hypothetical protein C8E86_7954 [Catellatospora citrea]|nr:hypothetical protein C8E86_7954 [Catellatospora citrea]